MTVKTTLYLPDEDKASLEALAARTGVSEAQLLREGLRLVLARGERPRPHLALGSSRDGRTAADSDAALQELGFGT